MDSTRSEGFPNQRRTISLVIAIVFAAGIASVYCVRQRDWLNDVTLEVTASSAPGMAMSHPTRGALWLKMANGQEQTIPTKLWAGPTGRAFSPLRFNFRPGNYQKVIFYPDPSLQEVEIAGVRLIAHHDEKAIALPLDRVQSEQSFVTINRTPDSVSFKRNGGNELLAIDIEVTDLQKPIGPSGAKLYFETALVFLLALLAGFSCAAGLSLNSFSSLNALPVQRPLARIGIVLGLVACMAAAAPENSHPDEYLHVEAARYYMHHWLPPSIDSEWVAPSFSHYGQTYLAGVDIGYFFAGKFALFAEPFFPDIYTTLRFFNAALFAMLLFWSARAFPDRPATSLLFLTPQLWYAFSGFNTEGWALFTSFILIGQLASQQSSLQQYLRLIDLRNALRFLLPALAWSSLLLLSKRNFFLVLLFFATWLFWQLLTRRFGRNVSSLALKILPLLLLPFAFRFAVQTYQGAINQGDLPHAIVQQAEKYADPDFKPSALKTPGQGFAGIQMRARGYTLGQVLIDQHWLGGTISSFFGAYGWMAFFSPPSFYLLMGLGWFVFIGCVLVATFSGPSKLERIFCGIAWLYLPLIIMISLHYSWTTDFQAQGRYLFPFLPILFYLVVMANPKYERLFSGTVWGLFILSAYGFIFFGLKALVT
ncbi:MAG: hypothetical protein QOI04_2301 [Verrucomicrobiota bacterium]|jgi:hypothetical protein